METLKSMPHISMKSIVGFNRQALIFVTETTADSSPFKEHRQKEFRLGGLGFRDGEVYIDLCIFLYIFRLFEQEWIHLWGGQTLKFQPKYTYEPFGKFYLLE